MRTVGILLFMILGLATGRAQEQQEFKTIEVDGMVWMAENLNVDMPGGYCYLNNKAYCNKYGRLYIYGIALKACPAGWHLPSREEWLKLGAALGGPSVAGNKMKVGGSSGFNAPMGGLKKEGGFDYFGIDTDTGFWSASPANPKQVYIYSIKSFSPVLIEDLGTIGMGLQVRCVQDNTTGASTPGTE